MALYRDIQLNKGTLLDRFGALPTNNGAIFSQKEKGLALDISTAKNVTYDRQLLPNGAFSVVIWAKLKPDHVLGTPATIVGMNLLSSSRGILLDYNTGNPILFMGANNYRYFAYIHDRNWHCFVFTMNGSAGSDITTSQLFVDGISRTAGTTSNDTPYARNTSLYVGSTGVANNSFVSRIKIYDTVLSLDEINREQIEFNNAQPINKPKRGFILNKPTDLSSQKDNTIGATILSGIDFTTGWTAQGGGTIVDADTISSVSTGGVIRAPFVAGKRYRISITGNSTIAFNILSEIGVPGVANTILSDFGSAVFTAISANMYIRLTNTGTFNVTSLIIQEVSGLIAAYNMQKVGNTLVDISGNGNNMTAQSGVVTTPRGIVFNGANSMQSNAVIQYGSTKTLSICYRGYIGFNSVNGALIESSNDYNNNDNCWSIGLSSTNKINVGVRLNGAYGAYVTTNSFTSGFYTLEATIDTTIAGASFMNIYVNGVLEAKTVVVDAFVRGYSFSNYILYVGGRGGTSLFIKTEANDLKIYNRVLSAQEIKDYHNQFVLPTLVETFADEGADGLSKVPREWERVSGSFAIKEIAIQEGERLTNGNFSAGSTGWLLTGEATISGGQARILSTTGAISNIQQNGVIIVGRRYKLTLDILSAVQGYLRSDADGSVALMISGVGLKKEYYFTAMASSFNLKRGDGLPTDITVDNISLVEVPALDTLPHGAKYMECLSQGVIAIPNNTAYGSWEFDFYKGVAFSDVQIALTSITNTGGLLVAAQSYSLRFFPNTQTLYFYRANAALLNTAANYFTTNTWYRLKVTRTKPGVTTILIKGGTFTPTAGYDGWTLVSVIGGSGTNPTTDNTYTSSIYNVIGLGGTDRIANFVSKDDIEQ
jgi:hypothetical protein